MPVAQQRPEALDVARLDEAVEARRRRRRLRTVCLGSTKYKSWVSLLSPNIAAETQSDPPASQTMLLSMTLAPQKMRLDLLLVGNL